MAERGAMGNVMLADPKGVVKLWCPSAQCLVPSAQCRMARLARENKKHGPDRNLDGRGLLPHGTGDQCI